MAKSSGLGHGLIVAGVQLAGDTASYAVRGGPALLNITGIDKSAYERVGGLLDGALDSEVFLNDAASRAHVTLSTLPTTDKIVTAYFGTAIGSSFASIVSKQLDYGATRGSDGAVIFSVPRPGNGFSVEMGGGGEDGLLTAGLRTDTAATNGTSLDGGAATTTGWSAYLQVIAFDGTDVTMTIEDSANNTDFAAVTGAAFTQVADVTAERIASAAGATLRRYVRVATTTSGGVTSVEFLVALCRHPIGATA